MKEDQDKQKLEEILEYCRHNVETMWAAVIVGIIKGVDYRDALMYLPREEEKLK